MVKRTYWVDCSRVLSAFSVVLLHTSARLVAEPGAAGTASWWLGNIVDAMVRWCVPVFIMITGSLLLANPVASAGKFYRHRMGRLLIPLMFWTLLYSAYSVLSNNVTVSDAIRHVILGIPFNHMWYLYMLLGLYLVVPLLVRLVSRITRQQLLWVIVLLLTLGAVFQFVIPLQITGTFLDMFPSYIGYFLGGYYMASGTQKPIKPILPFIGFVVCGLVVALLTALMIPIVPNAWDITYNYLNPLVIVMSFCLFYAMQTLGNDSNNARRLPTEAVKYLAPLTLGIYLT